ncbi:MAG: thioredoxin-disulfide reductase [Anaerolineae bacterium]|nr:thioredoxin-disulfide reductase [Anaerolineae bacterium]
MFEFKLTAPGQGSAPSGAEEQLYDLIVLGGGPAGLTAAIYAGRARLKTLVLTGYLPGGQPANTDVVENFPAFPDGVSGPELAQRLQQHAQRFGARLELDEAVGVDFSARPFVIRTPKATYQGKTVIIAAGAVPRRLGVSGEERFFGRGVSSCATCGGFFYRDKEVVVVGGGDSALAEGLFLTRFARLVTIIHRRDELRATKIYRERALAHPKIRFLLSTVVEEILGDQTVSGVRVRNVKTGQVSTIQADGVFVYVGMQPQTELFAGQLALDAQGYIISDRRQRTSVPGVFVAGDVQDPLYRQIVVAAGTGAIAAMEAEKFLGEYPDVSV